MSHHQRIDWSDNDPAEIFVHTRYDEMKGAFRRSERDATPFLERYERAKKQHDMVAAVDIVENNVNDQALDRVVDALITTDKPACIVYPNPEYDAGNTVSATSPPTNAIPAAFAAYIASQLGGEVDQDICQIARPGRTKLTIIQRFLWQPSFAGPVRKDVAYVLTDDVCSKGGTLAALRHHIVSNGGTVVAVTTLANTDGCHVPFPIAPDTYRVLNGAYGPELDVLFLEEVGHATRCLTELEGQGLALWHQQNCLGSGITPIQRLRDRFAKAKEKGS